MSEQNKMVSILQGKESFDAENSDFFSDATATLFDRIINLKFKDGEGREFILRSDYEAVFPTTDIIDKGGRVDSVGSYYMQKCAVKPSIKVQYKQVSSGDAIQINVFVQNFFMLDKNGNMILSFGNKENPIRSFEIQMGYWNQFKNLPHDRYEDLFDFKETNGIRSLKCTNAYVTTDKLPPDATVCIHGWIGNSYSPPVKASAFKFKAEDVKAVEGLKLLEEILFKSITKRFWRDGVAPKEATDSWFNEADDNYKGTLKDAYAKKYGTKVYLTEGAKKAGEYISKKQLDRKDADGNIVAGKVESLSGNTILQALNDIRKQFGLRVGFRQLTNGNYVMFTLNEGKDPDKLLTYLSAEDLKEISDGKIDAKAYDHMLPAVYNVNKDSLCTIVCPFFFYLDPFEHFYFASRYSLSGLVEYYANYQADKADFFALWMTVSFATVEDINECTIVCA